jgi:hypothetical protein
VGGGQRAGEEQDDEEGEDDVEQRQDRVPVVAVREAQHDGVTEQGDAHEGQLDVPPGPGERRRQHEEGVVVAGQPDMYREG